MTSKQGNLYIISAASGTGKTSLVHALLERLPNLHVSISHTTRSRRAHEQDGLDYHFVDKQAFMALQETGEFLESAQVFDHYYGTSRNQIEQQLASGKDIILEIDWQGAQQIRQTIANAITIFILPPTRAALESRLIGRGETEHTVARRMQGAKNELSHYKEYDFLVINDDFDTALAELAAIFATMTLRYTQQMPYFDNFVKQLLNDSGNTVK
jgi:guanylate kinase